MRGAGVLLTRVLLIAFSLRAPITEVAPIIGIIRESYALNAAAAGMLTTLPLFAFASSSPFCALLARKVGLEQSIFIALLFLVTGLAFRSFDSVSALFVGTGFIGIGIAVLNVLLPSLLKRDFPDRIGPLTSAYATMANLGSALTSSLIVPVAIIPGIGWHLALLAFMPIPLLALITWSMQLLRPRRTPRPDTMQSKDGPIWRSALAWQVTLFFSLNSTIFYVTIAWLPAILHEAGYSPASAGSLHAISQLSSIIPGLFLGILINRLKNQKLLAIGSALTIAFSFLGLASRPEWAVVWVFIFGVGSGASLSSLSHLSAFEYLARYTSPRFRRWPRR